jgi:hypothetical protein
MGGVLTRVAHQKQIVPVQEITARPSGAVALAPVAEQMPVIRPTLIQNPRGDQCGVLELHLAKNAQAPATMVDLDPSTFEKSGVEDAQRNIGARFAQAARVLLVPPTQLPDHDAFVRMASPS